MQADTWPAFAAAYEQLCASFGRRVNDTQAQRWHQKLEPYPIRHILDAFDLLEENGTAFPTLPKVIEVIRGHEKSAQKCAACNGSGVVFGRRLLGRKQLAGELWHGKGAMECDCVARGAPLDFDPALPGNPECSCGGRGWNPYPNREAIPEGREYMMDLLSGGVMGSCPCQPSDRQRGVSREVIPVAPHQDDLELRGDMDVLSGMWAVD